MDPGVRIQNLVVSPVLAQFSSFVLSFAGIICNFLILVLLWQWTGIVNCDFVFTIVLQNCLSYFDGKG